MSDTGDAAEPAAPSGTTVRDPDWNGADLSGRTWTGTTFLGADAAEAVSSGGTVFTDCVFRDAVFHAAQLTAAAFVGCTFTGCDFFGARLLECKLLGSDFDRCSFDSMVAEGGDWSFVRLAGADLRRTTLRGLRMREADLGGARCDGAVDLDLDLARAVTDRASFVRADLRGSDLSSIDPLATALTGAVIDVAQAVTVAIGLGLRVD